MYKTAVISDDKKYRYSLWRVWDATLPSVMFLMLNPSTADATEDDPTIKRCISFAKSWGFGGIAVVNLFAWRATIPRELLFQYCPEGSDNDHHIRTVAANCALHIAAWGNGDIIGHVDPDRPATVRTLIDAPLFCLTKNADGNPGHPLYLKADTVPILY